MVSWIRWRKKKLDRPGRPKRIVKVCWDGLAEDPVKMVSNSNLRQSFNHIPEVVGSMESEWAIFYTAIVEVAARNFSNKVTGASCGSNPRTRLWTLTRQGCALGLPKQQTASSRPSNLWLGWSLRQKPGCGRSLVRP